MEWNVSLREPRRGGTETLLVTSPLWPPYSVQALPETELAREKVEALLRRMRARDFFDLYYLLRERLGTREIAGRRKELAAAARALDPRQAERELREFLPSSHRPLLRELGRALLRELERS